jgi:hypothetical protein
MMMENALMLLMLSLVTLVKGEQIFYNQEEVPIPRQRYQRWSALTITQNQTKIAAERLTYTETTWEEPPFAIIEMTAMLDLTTSQQDAALEFGYTEDTWDCFINHYNGYDWSDLIEWKQDLYLEALGWTENVWDNSLKNEYPASESKDWNALTDFEKQAAANICYFPELWDEELFSTDWVNTSPFLFPVTPAPAPVGGFCFPGSSTVSVKGKGMVALHKVKLGDEIMVEKDIYEPIYSFGHYNREAQQSFVKVVTTKTTLEITAEHMVFSVHKGIIPASAVEVGDELVDSDGQATLVNKIESVVRQGVYAPFTPSGKLIVDGITVSSYVAFQDSAVLKLGGSIETPFSYHWMAHTFNFPHRFYCQYVVSCTEEQYTEDGVSTWVTVPFHVAMWIFRQNAVVMGFCMTVLIAGFSVLAVLEMMPVTSIAILVGYYYASRAKTAKKQL